MTWIDPYLMEYPDPQTLSESAAEYIYKDLLNHWGTYRLAICGGSSPVILFESLSRLLHNSDSDIRSRLALYWIDERAVDPEDPESNYGRARNLFVKPAGLSDEQVFPMRGELGADQAARNYEDLLTLHFSGARGFDLALIGMGSDGHIASLFPDHPALAESKRSVVSVSSHSIKISRITVTLPMLQATQNAIVLAIGSSKASALDRLSTGPGQTNLPVSMLPFSSGRFWIYADRSATGSSEPENSVTEPGDPTSGTNN